jgi:hypothetical protein
VWQDYDNAIPESKNFKLQFIKVLSVCLQNLAARLFLDAKRGLRPLGPEYQHVPPGSAIPKSNLPSCVFADYINTAPWMGQGPGSACVGYWLEWQIFQGVVLFEHPNKHRMPKKVNKRSSCSITQTLTMSQYYPNQHLNAFLDRGRKWMLVRLPLSQIEALLDFGSGKTQEYPLPFKATKFARRVDRWKCSKRGFYRGEPWERLPHPPDAKPSGLVMKDDEEAIQAQEQREVKKAEAKKNGDILEIVEGEEEEEEDEEEEGDVEEDGYESPDSWNMRDKRYRVWAYDFLAEESAVETGGEVGEDSNPKQGTKQKSKPGKKSGKKNGKKAKGKESAGPAVRVAKNKQRKSSEKKKPVVNAEKVWAGRLRERKTKLN